MNELEKANLWYAVYIMKTEASRTKDAAGLDYLHEATYHIQAYLDLLDEPEKQESPLDGATE